VGNRITEKQKKADIDNLPLETEDGNNVDELLNYDNSMTSDPSLKSVKKRSQARIIRSVWFNKDAQPENIIES
jgi:hypothetical protein